MTSAVFLDRDGVLNRAVRRAGRPHPPATLEELELLPGAVDACARLRGAGLPLLVVTNQPDVARGTTERRVVEALNDAVRLAVGADEVLVCWHDDGDACECRKPAPGLLRDAAERLGLVLGRCVMVGDRWRDIEAGERAGCHTVLVDHGWDERRPDAPDLTVPDLASAVDWILGAVSRDRGGRP